MIQELSQEASLQPSTAKGLGLLWVELEVFASHRKIHLTTSLGHFLTNTDSRYPYTLKNRQQDWPETEVGQPQGRSSKRKEDGATHPFSAFRRIYMYGAGGLETALLKLFWGEEVLVPHPVILRVYPMLREHSKDHIWNHMKYCSGSS